MKATPFSGQIDGLVSGVVLLVTLLLLIVGVGHFRLDFSAGKYLENDLVVGRPSSGPWSVYPFDDFSGLQVWMAGDAHIAESIASLELPVWNRFQGGGYSPAVAFQNGVFYPLRWAMAWLDPRLASSGFMVCAWGLMFLGLYLLCRHLTGSVSASLAAAISYLLLPHSLVFAQFDAMGTYGLMPWILLFALRSRGLFDAMFLLQCLALALLLLSGHPLLISSAWLGMLLFLLIEAAWRRQTDRLGEFFAAGLFAAGLAALAWFPLVHGLVGEWNYKTATTFGKPYVALTWADALALYRGLFAWNPGPMDQDALPYVFRLPPAFMAFALMGAIRGARRPHGPVVALAALVGLLVAIPGPHARFLEWIPLLSFSKPTYLLVIPFFFLTLLVAFGLVPEAPAMKRQRFLSFAALAALLLSSLSLVPESRFWWPRPVPLIDRPAIDLPSSGDPFRVAGALGQIHLPNLAQVTRLEDVRLISPIQHERYHLWVAIANSLSLRLLPTFSYPENFRSPLLPLFNVRFVFGSTLPHSTDYHLYDPKYEYRSFLRPRPFSRRLPPDAHWIRDDLLKIAELPNARPRAFLATRPLFVPDLNAAAHALLAIQKGRSVAFSDIVEASPQALRDLSWAPAEKELIRVRYHGNSRVTLKVLTKHPRLVVLNDTLANGWKATVDGVAQPIIPVNLIARGVAVPAGEHEIEMSYQAPGLASGALVSFFTGLLLFLLKWRHRSRRRRIP